MGDDHRKRREPMPLIRAGDFRALSAFLRGYLHQDFHLEYKTPRAALEAYRREATPKEVDDLRTELERFLADSRGLPFDAVQRLLTGEFGSGWLPANREDLFELSRALRSS